MKNIFTLYFLFSITLYTSAQSIPNSNLDIWDTFNSGESDEYEEPKNWHTPNEFTAQLGAQCVTKSDDAYSGDYAARLETIDLLGGFFQAPGMLTIADFWVNISTLEFSFSGGLFLQEHVSKLSGMYKYSGADGDSASVIIYSFKHPEGEDIDTIGMGVAFLHDTADWTPFEIDMEFNNDHLPDTFNVIILSSGSDNLNTGSVLYVDSISIETITGTFDLMKPLSSLHVFPNPAVANIRLEAMEIGSDRSLFIFDANGRLVMNIPFNNKSIEIDLHNLNSGLLTYTVTEKGRQVYRGSFVKK